MPIAVADRPSVKPAGRHPAVKPSIPEVLSLDEDEMRVKTPLEILAGLPEPVRKLHNNVRMLIVDDFLPTAENLKDKLALIYRRDIEVESDPIKARNRIIEASEKGNPYGVVILDLYMTRMEDGKEVGINGDQLLRDVAAKKALGKTKVLIHSGEWADRIQGNLWHQLERIKNTDDLASAGGRLWEGMGRVPVTYARKYGTSTTLQDIVAGIDALLITGDRKPENLEGYLSRLKVDTKMRGSDIDKARIVEVVSLINTRLQDYATEVESNFPGFLDAEKNLADSVRFYKEKVAPDVTLEGLKSDRARNIIHDTYTPLRSIVGFVSLESIAVTAKAHGNRGVEPYLQNPNFIEFTQRYSDELRGYARIFDFLRMATREEMRITEDMNDLVKKAFMEDKYYDARWLSIGEAKLKFDLCEGKLPVSTPMGLLFEILRQPVSNAAKAVRDSPKKEVTITTGRGKVGTLPAKANEYFHGLGLKDEDDVAMFSVADTGCGIKPEDLPQLGRENFSRFRERGEGTGFGLNYLAGQIGRCNGTWHVESELDKGTKFRVYFKLAEAGG